MEGTDVRTYINVTNLTEGQHNVVLHVHDDLRPCYDRLQPDVLGGHVVQRQVVVVVKAGLELLKFWLQLQEVLLVATLADMYSSYAGSC